MADMTDIEGRIKKVIGRKLRRCVDVDTLTRETHLIGKGLGLDSIALHELVVGLEEEFGLYIEDSELSVELFDNIGSVAAYISEKVNLSGG